MMIVTVMKPVEMIAVVLVVDLLMQALGVLQMNPQNVLRVNLIV